MSILASLVRAYDRLPEKPEYGYSSQNIGVVIGLNEDGSVATMTDWRQGEGRQRKARPMLVPQPVKRTAGIAPNFLWDKTSYVLGVTAGEGKRTAEEYDAFRQRHEAALAGTDDAGLKAFLLFLRRWTPEQFVAPLWPEDIRDHNVVFVLESDRRDRLWLHERPAAKRLWQKMSGESSGADEVCLVTGDHAPVARLHPAIKGVWGGQSSGGSIVSFNFDAVESYGHAQGDNAPVSEAAAFAYTTALNRFLQRDSGHRIQLGDASTVFWADAADREIAALAIGSFFAMFADESDAAVDAAETRKIGLTLERLRRGEQLEAIDPRLSTGVRFHVLGLAPNAARIAIRFWFEDDFGVLAKNYQRFVDDMRIEPPWHREAYPPLWRYLGETAVLGKRENVPPNLASAWMGAILGGTAYPRTLLATVLSRIRADGEINALRVAMLKAVLVRNDRRRVPVALDVDNRDKGYLLGRLFAVYEQAQAAALGRNVNASIKDKFYGSASATPRNVFAVLDRGSANHLAKVGREKPGLRHYFEQEIAGIMNAMSPDDEPFPAALPAADQALFGLGYYHQKYAPKRDNAGTEAPAQ